MPRSGINGTYSLPPGVGAYVPGTTILSAPENSGMQDIAQTFNTKTPISYGGTNAETPVTALDNLTTKAGDIPSGTTTDIWAASGEFVHITGTTTITSFGTSTAAGNERTVVFDGSLTLTHNASTLILPNGANIVTSAGDVATVRSEGGAIARVVSYTYAAKSSTLRYEPVVPTTSGANIDTNVPSWVRRITVRIDGVSDTGVGVPFVQLGDSGGFETSGYLGAYGVFANTTPSITNFAGGFIFGLATIPTQVLHGGFQLDLLDAATNTWTYTVSVGLSSGAAYISGAGSKSLSGTLTSFRIGTLGAFDAGKLVVIFE